MTEKSKSLIDVAFTTNESIVHACDVMGHVAALLTLKANWFDTLTVKQWEIMINNDVLLFSATNEETPYEEAPTLLDVIQFAISDHSSVSLTLNLRHRDEGARLSCLLLPFPTCFGRSCSHQTY